jgi:hypothetical protein
MKLILILTILTTLPVLASKFGAETEPSAEDSSLEASGSHQVPEHNGAKSCSEVSLKGLVIRPQDDSGNLHLEIHDKNKVVGTFEPYLDGPGSKCLKLKELDKDRLILLELCHGITGTSVLVERHSLLVLRLDDNKLRSLGELELKYSEEEGDVTKTVFDKTYETKRKDGQVIIKLKDRISKKESEFRF